jgi:hypothetical protein
MLGSETTTVPCATHVQPRVATRSEARNICPATGRRPTFAPSNPVETRSTTPHSQIAPPSRPVRPASHSARAVGSTRRGPRA